jgi:hypothetical protein
MSNWLPLEIPVRDVLDNPVSGINAAYPARWQCITLAPINQNLWWINLLVPFSDRSAMLTHPLMKIELGGHGSHRHDAQQGPCRQWG